MIETSYNGNKEDISIYNKDKNYIRTIMTERFSEIDNELSILECIKFDVAADLDSYNCFFHLAADEINADEIEARKSFLISIFE